MFKALNIFCLKVSHACRRCFCVCTMNRSFFSVQLKTTENNRRFQGLSLVWLWRINRLVQETHNETQERQKLTEVEHVQICRRERLKCGHVSQDNKTETQILFAFILTFYLFINTKFAPTYLVFKVSQWRYSRLHYEIYCNYTSIIQSTRLNSFLHGKVSEQLHYFFLKNRQFT